MTHNYVLEILQYVLSSFWRFIGFEIIWMTLFSAKPFYKIIQNIKDNNFVEKDNNTHKS